MFLRLHYYINVLICKVDSSNPPPSNFTPNFSVRLKLFIGYRLYCSLYGSFFFRRHAMLNLTDASSLFLLQYIHLPSCCPGILPVHLYLQVWRPYGERSLPCLQTFLSMQSCGGSPPSSPVVFPVALQFCA